MVTNAVLKCIHVNTECEHDKLYSNTDVIAELLVRNCTVRQVETTPSQT